MAAEWKLFEGRQLLGRLMHGENVLVGTPDVALSTTTFGVAAVSNFPDEYFLDWHGRFYAGPNMNKNFEVTKFDQKESTPLQREAVFTFTPAATIVVTRDLFELYQDYSPSEMNDAINLAIDTISNEALQDLRDESLSMKTDIYEYDVPGDFAFIEDVLIEQTTAGRFSYSDDMVDRKYWKILPGNPPRLWFDDALIMPTNGRKLRLIGQKRQAQLAKDEDLCSIGQTFIILQAKAFLHFARSEESGDDHHKKMVTSQSRADIERLMLRVAGRGHKVAF